MTWRVEELILVLMMLLSSLESKLSLEGRVIYMELLVRLLLQSIEESEMRVAVIEIGLRKCRTLILLEFCLCGLLNECDEPLDCREVQPYM